MRKTAIIILSVLLLSISASFAQEEDPGITPDSPLWGLDRAIERIEELLAAGDVEKAKVELEHAHERLLEVKAMIEQNRMEHAERARIEHKIKTERIKERIRNIDEDDEDAIEDEVELETEVEEEEREIEKVKRDIKIRIRGQLTDEQRAAIDALIDSFRNSTNDVRIEIEIKKNETRMRIKVRERLSDDEVDDLIEEHENRTGLNIIKMEKAREQIEDAEEEIQEAKEKLIEKFGSNATVPRPGFVLIKEAELHLENAKLAFANGSYGRAYGQATAAEHIAENIIRRLEHMDERDADEIERRIDKERREMMEEIAEKVRERRFGEDLEDCIEEEMRSVEGKTGIVRDRIGAFYGDIRHRDDMIGLVKSYGLEIIYAYENIPSIVVKVDPKEGFKWICILKEDVRIKDVDFDVIASATGGEGEKTGEEGLEGIAASSIVDLIGKVDYEGLPSTDNVVAIHGWKYFFIVDVESQEKAASSGINLDNKITLLGEQLNPELEQHTARIKGTFIKNYQEYLQGRGMAITSADPEGQVIMVSELEVLTR